MTPREAMLMAIAEGKKGVGFVSPNPLVGCVILNREFALIGSGYHARVGEGHAEVNALASVRDPAQLEGAHVYVTLEPCAFAGRTPSCAKMFARLPVASVTYGLRDPHPRVDGEGAAILRAAGIAVAEYGELKDELAELCEIFTVNQRKKRPFVALKVATTLDGKIAMPDGTSQWITGDESRAHVQYLRGCYDAVLVGAGTFSHDNPRLNSRDARFAGKRQRAVILDPAGSVSLEGSALLSVRPASNVLLVRGAEGRVPPGVRQVVVPLADGRFAPNNLLAALWAEEIYSVFVEGGAFTYAALASVADRAYVFFAPKAFGAGLNWMPGGELALRGVRAENFGPDVMLTGSVCPRTSR